MADALLFPPIVVWNEDGRPCWRHPCSDGEWHHDPLPLAPGRWQVVNGDSITPSLNCLACGTHGWWTNGRWHDA